MVCEGKGGKRDNLRSTVVAGRYLQAITQSWAYQLEKWFVNHEVSFSAANYLMMREGKGDTKRYLKCEKISFSESFCVDNFGIIHRTSLKKPIVGFYEGTLF